MGAVIAFVIALFVSLLVVRVASAALTLTGLSRDAAKFQARSAWTGTGFTTNESETVVDHPVRRRIITVLMIARGAGFVTVIVTLVVSFTDADQEQTLIRLGAIVAALVLLWMVATSPIAERLMNRVIYRALARFTDLDVRDFSSLLHLASGYRVTELQLTEDNWLSGRSLTDARLPEEGVLVLGIERSGGRYIGAPRGTEELRAGDRVLLYGQEDILTNLDQRVRGETGDREHSSAKRLNELMRGREEEEEAEQQREEA